MAARKGKGWHGDSEAHAQAGLVGGQKTAQLYGADFYREIGRKGGKKSSGNFKNNPDRARIAGRKGGKSRAKSLKYSM